MFQTMKKSTMFCLLMLLSGIIFAQNDQFTLRVAGMGCPFCAYGLEKKFKDVKGIAQIKIDIQTGKMTFAVPAETSLTLTEADARVSKAGYTAKGISVKRANGKTESMGDVNKVVAPTAMAGEGKNKQTFKVSGNCGMCEARIEKAARSVAGVEAADWHEDSKMITVTFSKKAKLADIQQAIAKSGHDNAGAKADDGVYDKLPACCQYRDRAH
jgi:periplasmic mercuric ion binding protein